ncbi:Cytochrome subunit of sulfide dehydrogenase [Aliarcobacter thereius]|uniref:Cytochrome subunit of sulfide dehydrogenase n=2 Tax=Aliarcobacter thereius TaxID=544718 RepID=A0A1C0B794_9BACT|nr:hypothetical protein [Aliarcobacter thereius]OCL86849.1 Cytochrome subunit of sulfide dehydrogenase [Aliarcobacter thereius]OCL91046.1 Cytochrome subunit of sulfide dehydrogenase [Aliarcobacter thereius]OCL96119.1 Cytochrome subunit of sulfide dehydrogenase [Aliarcobacter thereius LMG 24486]OCL99453.1 Cytochrome subunit of sulfide dehydrogenase [Aliarcobacter thereius]QBF15910.1 cytochrome c [Aliarcobacter thereius LMG 24486]
MKKILFLLFCIASLSFAAKYDSVRAEMLSLSCVNCHGNNTSYSTAIPSIVGKDKSYLYKTLLEYKSGKRVDSYMMQKHTKGFSNEELEQLAYYFSKIK